MHGQLQLQTPEAHKVSTSRPCIGLPRIALRASSPPTEPRETGHSSAEVHCVFAKMYLAEARPRAAPGPLQVVLDLYSRSMKELARWQ